ncbi:hypothetical protein PIB30_010587 [Stylosanthes scabra]|uniref:Ribonuclease H1 N-terminal domain-containing protein n=1 Tax=Stylosanthes scabra TaxID=79078 RepID=A0ABU6S545_9FABA|nr:hypothetical protein [Stylosanthes scabra]
MAMGDHPSTRYFCVYRGWCPGVYTFVEDFKEQIRDYEDPSYQFYTTTEEATRAWDVYFGPRRQQLSTLPNWDNDIPPPLKPPEVRHLERIALHALHNRHAITIPEGRRAYRYLVSLDPPNSSSALVVLSRVSQDCNMCRQDAARLGLRRLCQLVGGYVEDYSRDLVQTWRTRYKELGVFFEETEARMRELALQNQHLGEGIRALEDELRAAQGRND